MMTISMCDIGQPVAVTHSKGRGANPTSGSNLAWEKVEWQKLRDKNLKIDRDRRSESTKIMESTEDCKFTFVV